MTFLTTRFHLASPLTPQRLAGLSHLATVYGIRGLAFEGDEFAVEYDASRIHEAEVLGHVRRAGIDARPAKEIDPGAFDYRGEFKDFAWPTSGLTPVNQAK